MAECRSVRACSSPLSVARFSSCTLPVNVFDYLLRHSKQPAFADGNAYDEAVVETCLANRFAVVGVADYWRRVNI